MFETTTKEHKIPLRHKEKYKAINARTVTMENSAIPKMIKHLNKKHKEYTKAILSFKRKKQYHGLYIHLVPVNYRM